MALRRSAQAEEDQKLLKDMGYYRGPVDGIWGKNSIKAMAEYHANKGQPKSADSIKLDVKTMSTQEHQLSFTKDQHELDGYIFHKGYGYTDGDAWSKEEYRDFKGRRAHKSGSQHFKRLARDKNLIHNGVYLRKTSDHYMFGKYWESLSPYNRSGCRYGDGNHYERMEYLWGNPHFDKNSHYSINF